MMPCTVLHVEDDPSDRLIVAAAFRRAAPQILLKTAGDGDEAIAYLSSNPSPAVVLLDLKLPRKSGLEVLEWIRKQKGLEELPVIMLTSSEEPRDLNRATELGVTSYLVKTLDLKSLREIVKSIAEFAILAGTRQGRA
jgi:CheY-like chemotaxis protein